MAAFASSHRFEQIQNPPRQTCSVLKPGRGNWLNDIAVMKTMFYKSSSNPFMANGTIKPVHFHCIAPSAESVYLVGNFNSWNPTSHPMRRREDGWWYIEVLLRHGHHQYRFLVDDSPVLDPKSTGTALNESNEPVSLVAVS
jgi:1,4-alpha-glucan branching enzyme